MPVGMKADLYSDPILVQQVQQTEGKVKLLHRPHAMVEPDLISPLVGDVIGGCHQPLPRRRPSLPTAISLAPHSAQLQPMPGSVRATDHPHSLTQPVTTDHWVPEFIRDWQASAQCCLDACRDRLPRRTRRLFRQERGY